MLDKVLTFLRDELNSYLKVKTGEEDKLVIANVVDKTGNIKPEELGLSLINIEEERVNRSTEFYKDNNGNLEKVNPEIRVNLYVLITANFDNNYDEALKFLGHVLTFFQGKQVFNHQNAPALDPAIEKLLVELQRMTFEQQNNLWGMFRAAYVPSVLYKVRVVPIFDETPLGPGTPITEIHSNVGHKS